MATCAVPKSPSKAYPHWTKLRKSLIKPVIGADEKAEMKAEDSTKCELCGISFQTEQTLREHCWSLMHHIKLENKKKNAVHTCTLCFQVCKSLSDYSKHLNGPSHRKVLEDNKDKDGQKKKSDENTTISSSNSEGNKPQFQSIVNRTPVMPHNRRRSWNEAESNHHRRNETHQSVGFTRNDSMFSSFNRSTSWNGRRSDNYPRGDHNVSMLPPRNQNSFNVPPWTRQFISPGYNRRENQQPNVSWNPDFSSQWNDSNPFHSPGFKCDFTADSPHGAKSYVNFDCASANQTRDNNRLSQFGKNAPNKQACTGSGKEPTSVTTDSDNNKSLRKKSRDDLIVPTSWKPDISFSEVGASSLSHTSLSDIRTLPALMDSNLSGGNETKLDSNLREKSNKIRFDSQSFSSRIVETDTNKTVKRLAHKALNKEFDKTHTNKEQDAMPSGGEKQDILEKAENLCRDLREKRELAKIQKERKDKIRAKEDLMEQKIAAGMKEIRNEVENSDSVKETADTKNKSDSIACVEERVQKDTIKPTCDGDQVLRRSVKSTAVPNKDNLMHMVNMPRTHRERLKVAQMLRTHSQHKSARRFHLDSSADDSVQSLNLNDLPDDVKMQIAELISQDSEPMDTGDFKLDMNQGEISVDSSAIHSPMELSSEPASHLKQNDVPKSVTVNSSISIVPENLSGEKLMDSHMKTSVCESKTETLRTKSDDNIPESALSLEELFKSPEGSKNNSPPSVAHVESQNTRKKKAVGEDYLKQIKVPKESELMAEYLKFKDFCVSNLNLNSSTDYMDLVKKQINDYLLKYYAHIGLEGQMTKSQFTHLRNCLMFFFKSKREWTLWTGAFGSSQKKFSQVVNNLRKKKNKEMVVPPKMTGLSVEDLKKVLSSSQFGVNSPLALQAKVAFDIVLYFKCSLGTLKSLRQKDFRFDIDSRGNPFVYLQIPDQLKGTKKESYGIDGRRMWTIPNNPLCPVASLKKFLARLLIEPHGHIFRQCSNDGPFDDVQAWYTLKFAKPSEVFRTLVESTGLGENPKLFVHIVQITKISYYRQALNEALTVQNSFEGKERLHTDVKSSQVQRPESVGQNYESRMRPCSFFLEGRCKKLDCRFSHDGPSVPPVVCHYWELGTCYRGVACHFSHGYPSVNEQTETVPSRGSIRYVPVQVADPPTSSTVDVKTMTASTDKVVRSEVVGSKVPGSNIVGSKVVESKVVGSNVIGSKVLASKVIGSKVAGSKVVQSKSVDSIDMQPVVLLSRIDVNKQSQKISMGKASNEQPMEKENVVSSLNREPSRQDVSNMDQEKTLEKTHDHSETEKLPQEHKLLNVGDWDNTIPFPCPLIHPKSSQSTNVSSATSAVTSGNDQSNRVNEANEPDPDMVNSWTQAPVVPPKQKSAKQLNDLLVRSKRIQDTIRLDEVLLRKRIHSIVTTDKIANSTPMPKKRKIDSKLVAKKVEQHNEHGDTPHVNPVPADVKSNEASASVHPTQTVQKSKRPIAKPRKKAATSHLAKSVDVTPSDMELIRKIVDETMKDTEKQTTHHVPPTMKDTEKQTTHHVPPTMKDTEKQTTHHVPPTMKDTEKQTTHHVPPTMKDTEKQTTHHIPPTMASDSTALNVPSNITESSVMGQILQISLKEEELNREMKVVDNHIGQLQILLQKTQEELQKYQHRKIEMVKHEDLLRKSRLQILHGAVSSAQTIGANVKTTTTQSSQHPNCLPSITATSGINKNPPNQLSAMMGYSVLHEVTPEVADLVKSLSVAVKEEKGEQTTNAESQPRKNPVQKKAKLTSSGTFESMEVDLSKVKTEPVEAMEPDGKSTLAEEKLDSFNNVRHCDLPESEGREILPPASENFMGRKRTESESSGLDEDGFQMRYLGKVKPDEFAKFVAKTMPNSYSVLSEDEFLQQVTPERTFSDTEAGQQESECPTTSTVKAPDSTSNQDCTLDSTYGSLTGNDSNDSRKFKKPAIPKVKGLPVVSVGTIEVSDDECSSNSSLVTVSTLQSSHTDNTLPDTTSRVDDQRSDSSDDDADARKSNLRSSSNASISSARSTCSGRRKVSEFYPHPDSPSRKKLRKKRDRDQSSTLHMVTESNSDCSAIEEVSSPSKARKVKKKNGVSKKLTEWLAEESSDIEIEGLEDVVLVSLPKEKYQADGLNSTTCSPPTVETFPVGHKQAVLAMTYYKGHLYTCSQDTTAKKFNAATGEHVMTFRAHKKAVSTILVTETRKKGVIVITGGRDKQLKVFDDQTGFKLSNAIFVAEVTCMCEKWGRVYIGLDNGNVMSYNPKLQQCTDGFKSSDQAICGLACATEGTRRLLCISSLDSIISIRDANSGLLLRNLQGTAHGPGKIAVVDNWLYSASRDLDKLLQCHDIHTGQLLRTFKQKGGVITDIHCGRKCIFVSSLDGMVHCMNIEEENTVALYGAGRELLTSMVVKDNVIYTGNRKGVISSVLYNPANQYTCQFGSCSCTFGLKEHVVHHVVGQHILANKSVIRCLWKDCKEWIITRGETLNATEHIEKHVNDL